MCASRRPVFASARKQRCSPHQISPTRASMLALLELMSSHLAILSSNCMLLDEFIVLKVPAIAAVGRLWA